MTPLLLGVSHRNADCLRCFPDRIKICPPKLSGLRGSETTIHDRYPTCGVLSIVGSVTPNLDL